MDFRDHQPILVEEFKGEWSRDDTSPPLDHARYAINMDFRSGGIGVRPALTQGYTLVAGAFTSQFQEFVRSTGAQGFIWYDEGTRNLYYTAAPVPATPIDTAPVGTTGFSMISLYDRAYICYHNYSTGISGSNLKVYYEYPAGSGTWIFRDALGSAPTVGTFAAANSVTAGVISAGTHLFKVAYETNTGFITPASTAISYVATGGFACDLTNIPTGPANTVARHILVTKAIATYSGNPEEYEFFFLTRIADNTTTALSTGFPPVVNFYDSQLTSSADYLYDLISSVKSPMGMCMYNGRVVYWGFPQVSYTAPDGTTVNLDYGTFFVSNVNDPETISLAENVNKVSAADGGSRSIFCMAEYRGSLYMFKRGKTYATRDDGINVPSAWAIELVDAGFGCEALFGVARVESGQLGVHDETLFVANYNGLYAFQGSWASQPLSWKIHAKWRDVPELYFKYTKVVVQPIEQRVFVLIPPNSANRTTNWKTNEVWICDYAKGLTYDNVRWLTLNTWGQDPSSYPLGTLFTNITHIQTETVQSNSGNSKGLLLSFAGTANPGIWRWTESYSDDDFATSVGYAIKSYYGSDSSNVDDNPWFLSPTMDIQHVAGARVQVGLMSGSPGTNTYFNVGITVPDIYGNEPSFSFAPINASGGSGQRVTFTQLLNFNGIRWIYTLVTWGTHADYFPWYITRLEIFTTPVLESGLL